MLQHSRGGRPTGQSLADAPRYTQMPAPLRNPSSGIQVPSLPQLSPAYASPQSANSSSSFNTGNERELPPILDAPRRTDISLPRPYSRGQGQQIPANHTSNIMGAEATRKGLQSPLKKPESAFPTYEGETRERSRNVQAQDTGPEIGENPSIKSESDSKPSWAHEKTKAGKERKRLPLACIACRRKKIRCSGEKPACKHCTRARMPCVYKVTTRKATPRTDYMAMLDRRMKRMEERIIKCIPKEESAEASTIPRAIIRPSYFTHGHGKKRGAEEAFGAQVEEWVNSKPHPHGFKSSKLEESSIFKEGSNRLPSRELQEHLSEVYFEYVYGQSYLLMHKPTYMRKLQYVPHAILEY